MDKKELKKLGFSFEDSMANFIFAAHESCPAEELFQALQRVSYLCPVFSGKKNRQSSAYYNRNAKGNGSSYRISQKLSE